MGFRCVVFNGIPVLKSKKTRYLRLLVELIERRKNLVIYRKFDGFSIGKYAAKFGAKRLSFLLSPEVVNHQKATAQEIISKARNFRVAETLLPPSTR